MLTWQKSSVPSSLSSSSCFQCPESTANAQGRLHDDQKDTETLPLPSAPHAGQGQCLHGSCPPAPAPACLQQCTAHRPDLPTSLENICSPARQPHWWKMIPALNLEGDAAVVIAVHRCIQESRHPWGKRTNDKQAAQQCLQCAYLRACVFLQPHRCGCPSESRTGSGGGHARGAREEAGGARPVQMKCWSGEKQSPQHSVAKAAPMTR